MIIDEGSNVLKVRYTSAKNYKIKKNKLWYSKNESQYLEALVKPTILQDIETVNIKNMNNYVMSFFLC